MSQEQFVVGAGEHLGAAGVALAGAIYRLIDLRRRTNRAMPSMSNPNEAGSGTAAVPLPASCAVLLAIWFVELGFPPRALNALSINVQSEPSGRRSKHREPNRPRMRN